MDLLTAFQYCPRCQHKFSHKGTYHECPSCGLHYFVNPKPCTALVLVNEKDKYLLVERAVEPKKGFWDLPGGFVEDKETFEEGAIREGEEELGITVTDLEYLGSFYDEYDYQNVLYPTLAVAFKAKIPVGAQLKPADDVAGYKFFAHNDIPIDKVAFPSLQKLLKQLK